MIVSEHENEHPQEKQRWQWKFLFPMENTSRNTFSTVQRFIAMLDYGSDWGGVYFPIPHFFPIAASASVPNLQCHDSFREVRAL